MTAELTQEDIVTKLLTSNEVLKPQKGNFYISNPMLDTLGDFLLDIDEEYISAPKQESECSKFVFIK